MTNACASTRWFLCLFPPHLPPSPPPFPFSLIFHRKATPPTTHLNSTPNPSSRTPTRTRLSGPTATAVLSRYTVVLYSVALRFPGFGGVSQENRATPPEKGPVAPPFQLFKGVSHFKLPLGRCRGTGECCSYSVACRAAVGHLGTRTPTAVKCYP